MARKRSFVFWFGFLAILACLVYPPYERFTLRNGEQTRNGVVYRWVFDDRSEAVPTELYKIDLPRLAMEYAGVVILCGLLYVAISKKKIQRGLE